MTNPENRTTIEILKGLLVDLNKLASNTYASNAPGNYNSDEAYAWACGKVRGLEQAIHLLQEMEEVLVETEDNADAN